MKDNERERLIEVIRGMTREEHEVIAELIPIDLVLKRIGSEIQEKERLNQMIIGMGIAVQKTDPSVVDYGVIPQVKVDPELIGQMNRMKQSKIPHSFA